MPKLGRAVKWLAVALALLCGLLFGIVTVDEADTRHHFEHLLADVGAGDGINKSEAENIASAYFLGFVGACGGTDEGHLVNGEWVIPATFGYAGREMAPIKVDAQTGAIAQLQNSSFRNYSSFRLYLLWGIPIRKLMYFREEYYYDHWATPIKNISP